MNRRHAAPLAFAAALIAAGSAMAEPQVAERSATDLSADLAAGRTTSEELVRAYLRRIEEIDRKGPALHSVIALNPRALADARRERPLDLSGTPASPGSWTEPR